MPLVNDCNNVCVDILKDSSVREYQGPYSPYHLEFIHDPFYSSDEEREATQNYIDKFNKNAPDYRNRPGLY